MPLVLRLRNVHSQQYRCDGKLCILIKHQNFSVYSQSVFNVGGFLVAQFVRMLLLPSHWPFIAAIALSASCKHAFKPHTIMTRYRINRHAIHTATITITVHTHTHIHL